MVPDARSPACPDIPPKWEVGWCRRRYSRRMAVVVRLAGPFRVVIDGDVDGGAPGAERVVGSPKACRLLALLAARRGTRRSMH